jgi:maleate cis-trans isomerase
MAASPPLVGMVKPSKHAPQTYDQLVTMLPKDLRTAVRFGPVENPTLEEFEAAIPVYERLVGELSAEGASLIHVEGTPPFLILGHAAERRTVDKWQKSAGVPIFTSAMCQANALRALGVRKMVDAGYDPTSGPHAERYFTEAGFKVLGAIKLPIDKSIKGTLDPDIVFDMLAKVVRAHPGADGLCLQGSAKWGLPGALARIEKELGVAVVHPIAARYWELMARLGRQGAKPGHGRLLTEMPPVAATH